MSVDVGVSVGVEGRVAVAEVVAVNSSLSYALLGHRWDCLVQGELYGMNYCTPYPVADGVRDYFA